MLLCLFVEIGCKCWPDVAESVGCLYRGRARVRNGSEPWAPPVAEGTLRLGNNDKDVTSDPAPRLCIKMSAFISRV